MGNFDRHFHNFYIRHDKYYDIYKENEKFSDEYNIGFENFYQKAIKKTLAYQGTKLSIAIYILLRNFARLFKIWKFIRKRKCIN